MLDDKRERSPLTDGSTGSGNFPAVENLAFGGHRGNASSSGNGQKPALQRKAKKAAAAVSENTPASVKEMAALDSATTATVLAETSTPRPSGKRQIKVSRAAQRHAKVESPEIVSAASAFLGSVLAMNTGKDGYAPEHAPNFSGRYGNLQQLAATAQNLVSSLLTPTPSPALSGVSAPAPAGPAGASAPPSAPAEHATPQPTLVQAPATTGSSQPSQSAGAAPDAAPATVLDSAPVATISGWNADWRAAGAAMACGSCTGRACTICSIRIGGPTASNGQPTGYAARVLQYYDTTYAPPVGGGLSPLDPQYMDTSASGGTNNGVAALSGPNNAIVLENQKQGSPESEWMIGVADSSIEGFSVQFSLNHGERVDFKIDTDSTNYRIDIYRLGYYGGNGATKVTTINKTLASAQVQPDPLFDPVRKLVDAGNWNVSASWDVPADAVSGIYIAKLTRLDGSRGSNMIPFIVRDDQATSDITFQTSDTTWQAYNWWGGYNLYGGIDASGHAGRASAVSYNRPIITRDGGFSSGPQDFIFSVEYPTIRWLEQNGYDVNYITGIDTDRSGSQLLNSQVFLSVGHDEYWSAQQRANVEAARDAGVNLAFLSGNEVYWQVRWESSIDGTGTPYKTMVSYKERWDNTDTDPGNTTSTWRDPELGAGQPENGLTGTIFTVDSYRLDTITIPYDMSNFRFWSNTAVADLQPGQVYSLQKNLLGYEWDSDLDNGARPAGLINLSSTTVDVNTLLLDYGNTTGPGTATHALTMYRAPSGALVFGAGTVYWSWGLDSHHDNEATPTDPNVQQAMVNLFAEMGIQPGTLMASLVAASKTTDHAAPVSVVTSPTQSGSYTAGQPVVISGTATDSGGGLVAVVEVSTDGGTTWRRASGLQNWTYTFTPLAGGTYNIKTRAVDDSVNLETPGAGVNITVTPAQLTSLFSPSEVPEILSDRDSRFVNIGMRFSSSQSGTIIGMKFYKGLGDGGTHVGTLWSSTGTKLATATFTNETASGWQTVVFSNPVQISAGTTYMVSYLSSGHYADTENYFTTAKTNGPLTAPAGNGYYTYADDTAFPTSASNGVNYFVDVIFSPTNSVNAPPVGVNDNGFQISRDTSFTFTAAQLLANDTDPNGDILSLTGAGAAAHGSVTFNAQNNTITFTPTAGYTGAASFGYSISDGRGGVGSAIVNMTVADPAVNQTIFSATDTPANLNDPDRVQLNLGVRFSSSVDGTITGIKYYKGSGDVGTHTGTLWSSTGTLIATATFTNETASGWQTVTFSNPVAITAGTSYVASFHSFGGYTSTSNYFATPKTTGPLTATAGVYTYGNGNLFPSSTYANTNYWVDVVFSQTPVTNTAPVATNDTGYTTTQNTALQIAAASLLANDTDANGDPLTITGVSAPSGGTATFNAQTNTITFTPTAGYSGAAGFTYAISDGRGGTSSATVSLNVTVPNTPPVATNDSGYTTQQGTALQITAASLLANDTDANGDPLTITGVSAPSGGTAVFNAQTNTITFTPTAGYTGAAGFTYAISDGKGGTASATVALTVTATPNTAPVATNDTGYTTTQNTALQITAASLLANDTDANGDPLTITGVSAPSNGTATFNAQTNTITFTPTAGYTGAAGFTYAISDGRGGASSATVSLNVTAPPPNTPPVATNDTGFTTQQNTALQITAASLLANDTDANGDPLTITGVSAPSNGTATFNAQTNTVTFTPTAGYTGAAGFTYAISDGKGGTSSATVSLNVTTPPPATQSLFASNSTPAIIADNDPNSVELGMKFTASTAGTITGIKFYKGSQNTGTHTGSLWTSTGSLMGTLTFTNETASGWQSATFNTPIQISAGQTYVVSYHTNGFYSANNNYFTAPVTNGPLTAPVNAGVYAYGSSSVFPTSTWNASNYWVDVMFNGQLAA
ncbi:DUF4082 domain-containing protein [Mesorhizobium sp. Root552]|uniref:DUF4082 domain-containing protein n=1 Tax=Mesorhizobium sp. Root552 TaxID=1736555 RepID=UPI001FCD043F|nr:DUF4082 domain-containing protein [Mesorhizobium sp. Root552]